MKTTSAWIAVVCLAVAGFSVAADTASAESGGRLDLVAQTTWIGEFPAAVDLRISGAPADARLAVRILAPVNSSDDLVPSGTRPDVESGLLAFFELTDLEAARVGSGEVVSVLMPDDEIGELLRRDRGALTLVIDLMSEDAILDTLVTHFLVVGEPSERGHDLSVALTYDMRQPLALQPDITISLDPLPLRAAIDFLLERPDTPISVRLNAETVEAADSMPESDVGEDLRTALAGRHLLLEPWVDLDEEAWRAVGEAATVISQYSTGRESIENALSTATTSIVSLDPDADTDTITLLRSAGADGLITSPDRIRSNVRPGPLHNALRLFDTNGIGMPVLVTDIDLMQTLDGSDPELAAQRAVVELALDADRLLTDGVSVLDITDIDPVALDVLLEGIALSEKLQLADLADAMSLSFATATSGVTATAALIAAPAPDLSSAASDLNVTRSALNSYASMVPTSDAPTSPLRLALRASVSSSLQPDGMPDFTSRIFEAIDAGTRGVSVIEGERITLTTRTADIELLLRNEQTLPITVDLLVRSEKLRFPDGEHHLITLQPGDNPLTVRVEALGSGDARVTATLTSPDGRIELARGNINVRSTAISGIGLAISVISLLILMTWWARTILRMRRNRSADSFTEPTETDHGSVSGDGEGES